LCGLLRFFYIALCNACYIKISRILYLLIAGEKVLRERERDGALEGSDRWEVIDKGL